jgi:hypothetical protein
VSNEIHGDEDNDDAQLELAAASSVPDEVLSEEEALERERTELLRGVSAGKLDTLQERVAWILNHYREARDSDIALQLLYWEAFEPDLGGGEYVRRADLYKLTRLNSLARARAKIQNTYGLFQASPSVKKFRGKLSDEERQKAAEQQPTYPLLAVYADESGKTGRHLIVGSVWFLHPPEILAFLRRVDEWRQTHSFSEEFHFKTITQAKLPHYKAFADFLVENAAVLSFKAMSVERAGIGDVDEALQQLYYHLLVRGVQHEHESGRAPLPRGVQLWKDLEEVGRDKLFLAGLEDRLRSASEGQFGGQLTVDEFEALDSAGQILIQVADLYTSSINRVLNAEGARQGAKDVFADHLLGRLGLPSGPVIPERQGDMAVLVSL